MKRAVGIDIGTKNLKIAEVEKIGNKYKISNFFNIEVPLNEEDLIELLKEIFSQQRIEKNNVVLALSSNEFIVRVLLVEEATFNKVDSLKEFLKYTLEKYIPWNINEIITEYYEIERRDKKVKFYVVGALKESIEKKLEILKKVELDPVILEINTLALLNIVKKIKKFKDKKRILFIDIGGTYTNILVIDNTKSKLQSIRTVRLGVSPILNIRDNKESNIEDNEEKLKKCIDIEIIDGFIILLPLPEEFDGQKETYSNENLFLSLDERIERFLEKLIKEIKITTLSLLGTKSSLDLICLSGGGSNLKGLKERIEKEFSTETVLLDLKGEFEYNEDVDIESVERVGGIAVGLALELLSLEYSGLNFRKEEFSYTNKFEIIKIPLSILVSFTFLILFLLGLYFHFRMVKHRNFYNILVEKAEVIWERNFKDESFNAPTFDKIYTLYDKLKWEIEDAEESNVPPIHDCFYRWLIISKNFYKVRNRRYITIDHLLIEQNEGLLEGEVDKDESLDLLTKIMRSIKEEIDPSPNKTRIIDTSPNPKPSDKKLTRRYRFQIGFKTQEEE